MRDRVNGEQPGAAQEFSREAWAAVSLATADRLAVPLAARPCCLEVELTNGSGEVLDPGPEHRIAFSFRILDRGGQVISHESIRTPLEEAVPPGRRHRQKVLVNIAPEVRDRAAGIRVSMLVRGRYWVEQVCPDHARVVRLVPDDTPPSDPHAPIAPGEIWPARSSNGLRWPYGAMMVDERHRLLYIPIAKCACTSLKSMMVRLARIEQPETAILLDVHRVADRFNTGVQLKDKPIDVARAILAAENYTKFTVMRDPLERLVSAYLEKFVYNRHLRLNRQHIRGVLSAVQGRSDIALDPGISFREFVTYIQAQDPYDLDPHWRPQHLYFIGVPHLTRIFRLEAVHKLARFLREVTGEPVALGHRNRTRKSDTRVPGATEMTAAELERQGAFSPLCLVTPELERAIRDYYAADFDYYARAG